MRQVQSDLLDVNKTIFDEMARHTKAMSAIYARHSETSSSDMNSGASRCAFYYFQRRRRQ